MSGSNTIQISPNKKLYLFGKGFLIFKPDGETDFFHLGNCPQFTITPKTTTLDHFSSMQGVKERDEQIVTEKSMECKVQMEEFGKNQLRLILLGSVDNTDPDKPVVNIFTEDTIVGELRFYAANSKGPRWYITLPNVSFQPSGDAGFITDAYANMEVTGTVNSVDGFWGSMQQQAEIGTVAPEYILDPFIEGAPNVGDTLTANIGGVIGATTYTYLWKANGSAPGGTATGKTYVPVHADVGKTMTVVVTAHNDIGTDIGTSLGVGPVTEY